MSVSRSRGVHADAALDDHTDLVDRVSVDVDASGTGTPGPRDQPVVVTDVLQRQQFAGPVRIRCECGVRIETDNIGVQMWGGHG